MYFYPTRIGIFSIRPDTNPSNAGRWLVFFKDENLGSYHSPVAALDDLVGGHTFSAGPGIDTSKLGLPRELSEWKRTRP